MVAVGSLPMGTTALSATAGPTAVVVQEPAANAGWAPATVAIKTAAAPMNRAQKVCPARRRRCINRTPQALAACLGLRPVPGGKRVFNGRYVESQGKQRPLTALRGAGQQMNHPDSEAAVVGAIDLECGMRRDRRPVVEVARGNEG